MKYTAKELTEALMKIQPCAGIGNEYRVYGVQKNISALESALKDHGQSLRDTPEFKAYKEAVDKQKASLRGIDPREEKEKYLKTSKENAPSDEILDALEVREDAMAEMCEIDFEPYKLNFRKLGTLKIEDLHTSPGVDLLQAFNMIRKQFYEYAVKFGVFEDFDSPDEQPEAVALKAVKDSE